MIFFCVCDLAMVHPWQDNQKKHGFGTKSQVTGSTYIFTDQTWQEVQAVKEMQLL